MKKILLICLVLVATEKLVAQNPELKLKELGIVLPAPTAPIANYVKYVRSGNLVFLSGHGPEMLFMRIFL